MAVLLVMAGAMGVSVAPAHAAAGVSGSIRGISTSLHGVAFDSAGNVFAWGANGKGQLGDGTTTSKPFPLKAQRGEIPSGVKITQVVAASDFSVALGDDGRVYGWGSNSSGQLGDGTTTDRLTPVAARNGAIPAGVRITRIAANWSRTMALGDDGRVYGWGSNAGGRIGDGATTDRLTPVAVERGAIPADVKIVDLAVNATNTAVGNDGKAYTWGFATDGNGQQGTGTSTGNTVPAAIVAGQIPEGVKLVQVTAQDYGYIARGDDGRAYGWGKNDMGHLGNGQNGVTAQRTPTAVQTGQVPAGVRLTDVQGLGNGALALGDDGRTYAWGSNGYGEIGNGSTTLVFTVPALVGRGAMPAGVTVTALGGGANTPALVASDGRAYAWGNNASAQIGDGSVEERRTPRLVDFWSDPSPATPTTTTVTTSGSMWAGEEFRLTARVAPAAGGTVEFRNTSTGVWLGSAPVTSGVAAALVKINEAGDHTVTATFRPASPNLYVESTSEPLKVTLTPSPLPKIDVDQKEIATTLGSWENSDLTLTLTDNDTPVDDLTVTVTTGSSVLTPAHVTVTGTGSTRTVRVRPPLTTKLNNISLQFRVTDPQGQSGTTSVSYSASLPGPTSTGRYYYGDSDASTAIDVGDGHIVVADDEHQIIKLYKAGVSGYPVRQFDFNAVAGGTEIDIESAARVGDTIYWLGSYGNNRSGSPKADRRTMFSTTVTGRGADTHLTLGRVYGQNQALFSALVAWDVNNGHGLGANRLGFAAGTAPGVLPNPPSGFNIEGFEFAPGSTSAGYLGFRAPSINVDGSQRALIVPVTNLDALVAGTSTTPAFGAPILLDLGGRTIREIRKNARDEYLITAGPISGSSWALYAWDGKPTTTPTQVSSLPAPNDATSGAWETIGIMPERLVNGAQVELIADTGDATLYGADAAKDLNRVRRKAWADTFTLSGLPTTATSASLAVTGDRVVGGKVTLTATITPADATGSVEFRDGSHALGSAPVRQGVAELTTADLAHGDHSLTAVFTPANADQYDAATSAAVSVTIGAGSLTKTPTPVVTGTAKVGSVVRVTRGVWDEGVSFSYQWKRDGRAISGATKTWYKVAPADAGKRLTVTVTGRKSGYATRSKTSARTRTVAKGTLTSVKPRITGTAKAGRTLRLTRGSWTPAPVTYSYRWYANGKAITGATKTTYKVKTAHKGKKITVKVTGRKSGYTTKTVTSAAKTIARR